MANARRSATLVTGVFDQMPEAGQGRGVEQLLTVGGQKLFIGRPRGPGEGAGLFQRIGQKGQRRYAEYRILRGQGAGKGVGASTLRACTASIIAADLMPRVAS